MLAVAVTLLVLLRFGVEMVGLMMSTMRTAGLRDSTAAAADGADAAERPQRAAPCAKLPDAKQTLPRGKLWTT